MTMYEYYINMSEEKQRDLIVLTNKFPFLETEYFKDDYFQAEGIQYLIPEDGCRVIVGSTNCDFSTNVKLICDYITKKPEVLLRNSFF